MTDDDDAFGPVLPVGHRPSGYNEAIAEQICDLIASGKSLRSIECMPEMPCKATIFRWCSTHPEFNLQYHIALRWRSYARADEIIDIADDASGDMKEVIEDGVMHMEPNTELLARTKIRIDARLRVMAKENPKRYGEAPTLLVDHAPPMQLPAPEGQPGDNAKPVNARLIDHHPMDAQIAAWRKAVTQGD